MKWLGIANYDQGPQISIAKSSFKWRIVVGANRRYSNVVNERKETMLTVEASHFERWNRMEIGNGTSHQQWISLKYQQSKNNRESHCSTGEYNFRQLFTRPLFGTWGDFS